MGRVDKKEIKREIGVWDKEIWETVQGKMFIIESIKEWTLGHFSSVESSEFYVKVWQLKGIHEAGKKIKQQYVLQITWLNNRRSW